MSSVIDNFEHFPAEILLPIFSHTNDIDLANLGTISARFEPMVRELFVERYIGKYFLIEGEMKRHQEAYSKMLNIFGSSIRTIEAKGIRHIDDDHWLVKLLNEKTPNLEKLCFSECSFRNADNFLLKHIKITHLTFRGGFAENDYCIQLPEYRYLKSLELFNFSHISKTSLKQILCHNLQMERLVLKSCNHYFTLPNIVELVYKHLNHLKELNILDSHGRYNDIFMTFGLMDQFASVLTSLESFAMTLSNEVTRELLERVSLNCTNVKRLELFDLHRSYNPEVIESICLFNALQNLSLINCSHQDYLVTIVQNLSNLRYLSITDTMRSLTTHFNNAELLEILRKSKNLKKFIIESDYFSAFDEDDNNDETCYRKNINFHNEFIEAIPNPKFRLEFKEKGKIIGLITREEIIWRNKLLHWIGYDSIHNNTNLRLLDLANVSEGKHKQPLNLIFNYLDLDSLYSFCMTSKTNKQLVHNYIQKRCKTSPKKRAKQRSIQRPMFYITDEFCTNQHGLQMFGKCIKHLEVQLLDDNILYILNIIEENCKNLTTLCLRTRQTIDPDCLNVPQIRHFIFYGYDEHYSYSCNLNKLSLNCPNLEILEIKTISEICTGKKALSSKNLRKIKFKPRDSLQVKFVKSIFKSSNTEVVIGS